jgi:hypothetical protein
VIVRGFDAVPALEALVEAPPRKLFGRFGMRAR